MSYSGTVRCSHCYRRGHNKSGCPDLIKAYEEYKQKFAKYKKENPDCPDYSLTNVPWDIRNKMKVTWLEVEAAATMVAKERKSKNRQCTYCYGKAKSLTAAGYGIGALVQQKGERWDSRTGTYGEYNEMGVITDFNLNYCIIEFLRSTYQRQPTIGAHLGGERTRLMPHFNEQVKKELAIGRAWQSSPDHILLSRSHTPVPPAAHTEKWIRNSIKEDLKDWNLATVKAWFHRLEGIVEVPNEYR